MKSLKFNHDQARLIQEGKKNSTWRMFDDKDLHVNDEIRIIDKANEQQPDSWMVIGKARITEIVEKRLEDISEQHLKNEHAYNSKKEMLQAYRRYYGKQVTGATPVKIVYFDFEPSAPTQGGIELAAARRYTDGGA